MTTSLNEVEKALDTILADRKAYERSLNWAIRYTVEAKRQLRRNELLELNMQLPYVLNNIQHWRHPQAKWVRQTLRNWLKGR